MITKQDYLQALEVVEQYHEQLRREVKNNAPKLNGIGLDRGDEIIYIGGSKSQKLTKNNSYKLVCEPFRNRVTIYNDWGQRMVCSQRFF